MLRVAELLRLAPTRQISRSGVEADAAPDQRSCLQRGVLEPGCCRPDRQVEALGDQIESGVRQLHIEAYLWITPRELSQHLREHDGAEVVGRRHAQIARGLRRALR